MTRLSMATSQLQRPAAGNLVSTNARCSQSLKACSFQSSQRPLPLTSRHSTFCARNTLGLGKTLATTGRIRQRRSTQQTAAGLWFRQQAVSPGSSAASAAAAPAAAILSILLWQHAAQSACIVVASLALAVTVSRFLIVNSGKLEAGEVRLPV